MPSVIYQPKRLLFLLPTGVRWAGKKFHFSLHVSQWLAKSLVARMPHSSFFLISTSRLFSCGILEKDRTQYRPFFLINASIKLLIEVTGMTIFCIAYINAANKKTKVTVVPIILNYVFERITLYNSIGKWRKRLQLEFFAWLYCRDNS